MRLSLADVKKRVVRRKGELYLVPTLLRHDELLPEIAALLALHESQLRAERKDFPADRTAELIGDYRLAHALVIVLGEFYVWTPVAWPGPASAPEAQALADQGISSPGQLRLVLYDEVNRASGGYLRAEQREAALDAFAAHLAISRATLDTLLALDGDEHARLERGVATTPTASEVLVRYNQRTVEALLANASAVEWLLAPEFAAAQGTSLGTVLKRLCFLARRMGVLYDVVFDEPDSEPDRLALDPFLAAESAPLARVAEPPAAYAIPSAPVAALGATERTLRVTLYGPREVFGAPTQYGDRLARVCRAWLGYHRHARDASPARALRRASARDGNGLRGTALVELRGTSMRFALDEALLTVLTEPTRADDVESDALANDPTFDSALESRLYDEFSALARAGETFGWSIEREPEPLLAAGTILIADFALSRAGQRVYLEVAGFWTPEYRERKRRKLSALAGHAALIVAAPDDARAELSSLEALLPVLWFKGRVSAQGLLTLLRARFDDLAERRAALALAKVVATVERRGVVPTDECGALLGAFGRSEVAALAGDVVAASRASGRAPLVFVEGVGLLTAAWLERVRGALGKWVGAAQTDDASVHLELGEVARRLRAVVPGLRAAAMPESWFEALVWAAGFAVERASLFEPHVVARTGVPPAADADQAPTAGAPAQPRPPSRRRQHVTATSTAQTQPIPWDTSVPDPIEEPPRRGVRED